MLKEEGRKGAQGPRVRLMLVAEFNRTLRRIVPVPVKRRVRAVQQRFMLFKVRLRAVRRRSTLTESLEALRALDHRSPVPRVVLSQLFYGWANEEYTAGPEFLAAIVDAARQTPGPILECGCGLTTLVLGVEADKRGLEVYSLEHDSHWAKWTTRALKRQGVGCVTVVVAPLRSYGAFKWYDAPHNELPSDFSLVVCDGPPHTTKGGRYGLLPVLSAHLRGGGEVFLDDVARDEERGILAQWMSEFGLHSTIEGDEKPFARLRLPRK
jgi:predicted O-methyltransferase YrrM